MPRRSGYVLVGNPMYVTGITTLSSPWDPLAILLRVGPIVVDSLDGHSGRTLTHVGDKVLERICPTSTHSNSTSAIIFVTNILWIEAPPPHEFPDQIDGVVTSSMRFTRQMLLEPGCSHFSSALFASNGSAAAEIISDNSVLYPTRAATYPLNWAARDMTGRRAKDKPFAVAFAGHILDRANHASASSRASFQALPLISSPTPPKDELSKRARASFLPRTALS